MTDSEVKTRLEAILVATVSAEGMERPGGYWVGDKAAERQATDDYRGGRIFWFQAHSNAKSGLEYLAGGNSEAAELMMRSAETMYGAALETQMTRQSLRDLTKPAKRRGRPSANDERNERLSSAVRTQREKKGVGGKVARNAALLENPDLQSDFKKMGDGAIRMALKRHKTKTEQK